MIIINSSLNAFERITITSCTGDEDLVKQVIAYIKTKIGDNEFTHAAFERGKNVNYGSDYGFVSGTVYSDSSNAYSAIWGVLTTTSTTCSAWKFFCTSRGADSVIPFKSDAIPYFVSIYQGFHDGLGVTATNSIIIISTKDINTITLETLGDGYNWHPKDCPLVNGGNQIASDYKSLIDAVEIGKYNYNEGGTKTFDCSAYDYISIESVITTTIREQIYRIVSWTQ